MNATVSPRFYSDIEEEVYWLLENANLEIARKWRDAVWQTLENLKRQPYIGRRRSDLQPEGIRTWRVERFPRWLIFYTVEGQTLTILRVRYGTMDLPKLFETIQ